MQGVGGFFVRDDSKTIFQFQEQLGVVVIDRERAVIGMEEVVTEGGVELVVEGIVGTEAVIDAAVGDVDVGKGLKGEGVAQQVLGDTEGGQAGITVVAAGDVFMGVLGRERPVIAGIPVNAQQGIRGGCANQGDRFMILVRIKPLGFAAWLVQELLPGFRQPRRSR